MKPGVNKQLERQQRGEDFQLEVRRSWSWIPGTWRIRIPDGKGGSRPADELTLTESCNILAEMKRTESDRFQLSFLEPNQVKGLLDFDKVIPRNYGLVLVSFLNEDKGRDVAYAIRLTAAIDYMIQKKRRYIRLDELAAGCIPAIELPRVYVDNEPGYDLKGVATCYKYL